MRFLSIFNKSLMIKNVVSLVGLKLLFQKCTILIRRCHSVPWRNEKYATQTLIVNNRRHIFQPDKRHNCSFSSVHQVQKNEAFLVQWNSKPQVANHKQASSEKVNASNSHRIKRLSFWFLRKLKLTVWINPEKKLYLQSKKEAKYHDLYLTLIWPGLFGLPGNWRGRGPSKAPSKTL